MSMVARAVGSADGQLKVAGYECLVKIASLYYEYLPEYMQGLFNVCAPTLFPAPYPVPCFAHPMLYS